MLLDDIIELATDNKQSVAVLLRKCIVLAHQIRNDKLKTWANKELNGYGDADEVPSYRVTSAPAKGHFSGPWGAEWRNAPIPSLALEERHRHFATTAHLAQGICVYEDLVNTATPEGTISSSWPDNLALYYQRRIKNSKGMVLVSAYQEIPKQTLVELIDTVRTRILNLALEIQSEVGNKDADLKDITPQQSNRVDQTIIQNIYGSNIYQATGQSSMTVQQQTITVGDWDQLQRALLNSGLTQPDIDELSTVMKQDGRKLTGSRVTNWIAKNASKAISGGVKIGAAVGQTILIELLKKYLGLS